jgi:lipid II:glycine glycyltransferase (peptidoglycan interpeptide bridge formation enzyme)
MFVVPAARGKILHLRHNPVIDWKDAKLANETVAFIKLTARKYQCDFVRLSPLLAADSAQEQFFARQGFVNSQVHDIDAEITWVLDLKQTEEEVLAQMKKNTRYLIKRADRDGIKIEMTQRLDAIDDFWPIFADTVKRQQWSAYSRDYLRAEFETFVAADMAQIFLAKYQGRYIAGAIFIYYKDTCYYHHSGGLSEFRHLPAQYLIQWHSILEAKRRGLKTYNFFGIARDDDPNHPWAGLTFFKKGFGGLEQRYMHAKDLPITFRYWLTHFYEKYMTWRRGY